MCASEDAWIRTGGYRTVLCLYIHHGDSVVDRPGLQRKCVLGEREANDNGDDNSSRCVAVNGGNG